MLPKLFCELDAGVHARVRKRILNEEGDASFLGAFPFGVSVEFIMEVPRLLGAAGVVMRIAPDGEAARDIPMIFSESEKGNDRYLLTLDTGSLCAGRGWGLFYYEYLFLRGNETLFSDTRNNVDVAFAHESAGKFRLLVYEKDYRTPDWFRGATMYQIFPDRFCRGDSPMPVRSDAEMEPDWEHGIPQYAEKPGDPLANNRFFGGDLWGVIKKLDYLQSLGVNVLYLNPIFRAYSNHKYDTGDYETVDEMFGGEEAFRALLSETGKRGMHVILDGVFNHTGDDSKYFNRYGKYPTVGAYQSVASPYFHWYRFSEFPDKYESWWGIPILPRLNHEDEGCRRYFTGENGILRKYLKMGASGWRLDVADELSDLFLDELRKAVKDEDPDALIIGEVWENAADKISYGKRRRYLAGRQLDGVMNYPLRNGILSFVRDGDAETLYHVLTEVYGSYPRASSDSLMNLLGTHDTERILTVLGASSDDFALPNAELAHKRLTAEQRARAVKLLKIASAIQFTVFGVPSVYYGDEAGMEGYHDPFCRMPYPWGREDGELLAHYRRLGEIRKEPAFAGGDFRILGHGDAWIAYERKKGNSRVLILANRSADTVTFEAPGNFTELLTGVSVADALTVLPDSVGIFLSAK